MLALMMVEADPDVVETRLAAGEYRCVVCHVGVLRPWAFARRRSLRKRGEFVAVRPRRARCAACLVTHVLLPTIALLRRRDLAEVIGEALWARFGEGKSVDKVAEGAGVPHPDTARSWCRRFSTKAEEIRCCCTAWAHHLDASLGAIEPRGSPEKDALEAIGVAAAAAARRLGPAPLWRAAAGISGGRLLSNTSCPLPVDA